MKAVEILQSVSCQPFFARMEDGTFRWLTFGMEPLKTGPHAAWVERGLTARAASLYGDMNTQRPLGHDLLLGMLNRNIERKAAECASTITDR